MFINSGKGIYQIPQQITFSFFSLNIIPSDGTPWTRRVLGMFLHLLQESWPGMISS